MQILFFCYVLAYLQAKKYSLHAQQYAYRNHVQWSTIGTKLGVYANSVARRLRKLVVEGKLSQENFNVFGDET